MPKFYLRRFANMREQITRLPLGGVQPHTVSITDAAVQKDFYTINRDGYEPDEFEKFLSELETEASSALARTLDGEQWPPSPEDRYSLSCWIALQFLRGEATRQSGEETYRAFAKLEVGTFTTAQIRERLRLSSDVTDDQVEAIRARMLATADDFPVDHHDHLQQIAQSLKGMTNLVYSRRPWVLVHFKVKSLGTSDTPLTLVSNREDSAAGPGTGLGTAAGLCMPVSRRFGLYMGDLGGEEEDTIVPGSTMLAKQFNGRTLMNAKTAAFHHPDDDPFAGFDVPQPRTYEMDIPHEQIDELIKAFAKQQGRTSGFEGPDT